ncbi:response regulator [Pelagibius sp. 7325]|uniref:response regulator n=1 Tax=Pelagibius sp. 7325 TaxID=3131994 RepID=UPI0030EE36D8
MEKKIHIVVVDDEEDVRETLKDYLDDRGFEVTVAKDAAEMRRLVETAMPIDLAILDITMPGEDGLSLARYLRDETRIAIVMATASGATTDRIVGLELGADDYLPKPVDPRELLARIKAIVRRRRESVSATPEAKAEAEPRRIVAFGTCRLDLDSHKLFDEDNQEIPLKAMEFDLLKLFASRPNRVLNRDQLLELAHNRSWHPLDRSIDIRIARLRRKIEADPGRPEVIKTVRGIGYVFCSQPC